MGQGEVYNIIETHGDLKNNGCKLTTPMIKDIYKKQFGDVGVVSVNIALKKLRHQKMVNYEITCTRGTPTYQYWKYYDGERPDESYLY